MSKPENIPQDVWDHAQAFLIAAPVVTHPADNRADTFITINDPIVAIARAIMAAKAEEREACAQLADKLAVIDPEENGVDPYEEWEIACRVSARGIAAAIRKRGEG